MSAAVAGASQTGASRLGQGLAGAVNDAVIERAVRCYERRDMSHIGAVLIAGPTASGKSALALTLAERFGGTIVNADSMQVYRDLRIITARPTPEEEARVPHMLYGHVDAAENYSVGRWIKDVAAALDDMRAAGRLPILVGGTGLYFTALTKGLAAVPPIPPDIREEVRGRLAREGVAPLHAELEALDPNDRRAAAGQRSLPHQPRARSGQGDRPLHHRLAQRACRRCSTAKKPRRCFSQSTARSWSAASKRASMRCWPPARSTRFALWRRASSTRPCRP